MTTSLELKSSQKAKNLQEKNSDKIVSGHKVKGRFTINFDYEVNIDGFKLIPHFVTT